MCVYESLFFHTSAERVGRLLVWRDSLYWEWTCCPHNKFRFNPTLYFLFIYLFLPVANIPLKCTQGPQPINAHCLCNTFQYNGHSYLGNDRGQRYSRSNYNWNNCNIWNNRNSWNNRISGSNRGSYGRIRQDETKGEVLEQREKNCSIRLHKNFCQWKSILGTPTNSLEPMPFGLRISCLMKPRTFQ